MLFRSLLGVLLTVMASTGAGQANAPAVPPPTIASLGTCALESGGRIPDCRIAYRVYGRLNANRSNAVLIPTWLLGRSEDWIELLGPTKLVDTTQFFVILVDAFANGNSSSPSNTAGGRAVFRKLTIADMVEAQHRFVVEHLKLPRLHAVVGHSMGGMQAFEWAVRFPTFVDAVVPMSGTPRLAPYDKLEWSVSLSAIENGRAAGMSDDSVWTQVSRLVELFLRTPSAVNTESSDSVAAWVRSRAADLRRTWSLDDYAAQLEAMLRHDVSARVGHDMARAAQEVRAPMLIVFSWDDHMVTAGPAAAFARLVHADTLSLASACGHAAVGCESARAGAAVRAFLSR